MARYVDTHLIGSGGFGEVWRCERDSDGRAFAKKKLQDGVGADAIRRFAREVRILQSLDHPNIVRVIGLRLNEPPYFYVMPLYRRTLDQDLPSLVGDDDRIIVIFGSVLDGMEYAHEQGVVHRDLKPQNVLMNSDNELVISDFGLGREFDAMSTRQTQAGFGLGTPMYMAPEQVHDAVNADERADIYSLGRMLYEMYSGPLTHGVQDLGLLPPGVAVIVSRCTHREPERRFQSVAELKKAWRSLHDAAAMASQTEEFTNLLAEFSSATAIDVDKVQRFTEYLVARRDDSDLVLEALMGVTPAAFCAMYQQSREGVIVLMEKLVDFFTSQSWPFEYTDKLADRCRLIFEQVDDYHTRAKIVWGLIELGVDHNRWHVIGVARDLLLERKGAGESIPLAESLGETSESKRKVVAGYVHDVAKLDPLLRPFFEFEEEDE